MTRTFFIEIARLRPYRCGDPHDVLVTFQAMIVA
jgi:hypothetical protein